jgi:hypothetical protein
MDKKKVDIDEKIIEILEDSYTANRYTTDSNFDFVGAVERIKQLFATANRRNDENINRL